MPKPPLLLAVALSALASAAVTAGAMTFARPAPDKPAPAAEPAKSEPDDALARANRNLVAQLAECDRRLAELGHAPTPAPSSAAPQGEPRDDRARGEDGGRRFGRRGGEPTKEDWERMAETGTLRVRVPCIRDTPWRPSEAAVDRLGLAPGDADTIAAAYAESNKRMLAEIRPLCAKVLGSAEMIDKVGAETCVDAVLNGARKQSPEVAKRAIVATAEMNAGTRPMSRGTEPIEQLLYAMTQETRAFEADLAKKLGPDEAKRLAWAPEMCADRRFVRAQDEPDGPGRGGRRGR